MKLWYLAYFPCLLFAEIKEMSVVSGSAEVNQVTVSELEISVSDQTIINYKTFNIGPEEKVRFIQKSPSSKVLNRITGQDPSYILGKLESNGKVFFINPHGIFFGEQAQVDVGSLIVSTLDIADEDFKKGKYHFQLGNNAKRSQIFNQGVLKTGPEGEIVMLAPFIKNAGTILAHAEKIALIGAPSVTLDLGGDGYFKFAVEGELEQGVIEQLGQISALGAKVWMHLSTAAKVVDAVINKEGFIEGNFLTEENGVIKIKAISQMEAKELNISSRKVDIQEEKEDVVFNLPTHLTTTCAQIGSLEGNVFFKAPLNGKSGLQISAPKGRVVFEDVIGDKIPPSSLYVKAHQIEQYKPIKMQGGVTYQGDIFLGHNLSNTNHKILFDGPVSLVGQDRISIAVKGRGDVIFMSSLDGEKKLFIRAPEGSIQFNESIGKNRALLQLNLNAKNLSFKEIGGINPGVLQHTDVAATQTIDLHGLTYHLTEQRWRSPQFNLLGKGAIHFFSDSGLIEFSQGVLNIDNTSSFNITAIKGDISFIGMEGKQGLNVQLIAPCGCVDLGSVGGSVNFFNTQAEKVILHGGIKAENIKIEAQKDIFNYAPHKLVASTDVILNAKTGDVGSADTAIWVEAGHKIWIGAKNRTNLKGEFVEGGLCGISDNYPSLFIFNDFEYYESAYEITEQMDDLFSLAPEMVRRVKEGKIDPQIIEMRHSSIYYGAPK